MSQILTLSRKDPFHGYLSDVVQQAFSLQDRPKTFEVQRLNASNGVYVYRDPQSGRKILAKFFAHSSRSGTASLAEQEFHKLAFARKTRFGSAKLKIIKPLSYNPEIHDVLVEKYFRGRPLYHYFQTAHLDGGHKLRHKLTRLAWLLATVHNHNPGQNTVDFHRETHYFDKVIHRLLHKYRIDHYRHAELCWLKDHWLNKPCMWGDNDVLLHGDATPANWLFHKNRVVAIDFERSRYGDRIFDVGMLVGEMQHFFMSQMQGVGAAEQFIGHFLWEYACHFPDRQTAFYSITGRVPFYAALTLLRIARNHWIHKDHAQALVAQAVRNLR